MNIFPAIAKLLGLSEGRSQSDLNKTPDQNDPLAMLYSKAERGDDGAYYMLAKLHLEGRIIPKDEKAGMKWLEKAAVNGNVAAQEWLAECYQHGRYAPQDYLRAVEWLEKAAEQNSSSALFNLGAIYSNGTGVPKDEKTAFGFLSRAAEQSWKHCHSGAKPPGSMDAILARQHFYLLGGYYHAGRGCPQDYNSAAIWLKRAADYEHSDAQVNLGVLYENGQGVPQSMTEALALWQKAAATGSGKAAYNIALAYRDGKGVTPVRDEAIKWLRRSIELGHEAAREALVEMKPEIGTGCG